MHEPCGEDPDYAGTVPAESFMLFQMMFAIITPALISGAVAERVKFKAYLLFMVLWTIVVYLPLCHMMWGKGGLFNWANGGRIPVLDFAGGTVVHISSGVSALVFALVIGKRDGFPREPIMPHNVVLSLIGAGLLWVGWFGFNAGSALNAGALATSAFAATHFSAAAAALSWTCTEWYLKGKPSVLGAASGMVAGLATITPASGFVSVPAAFCIGLVAGVVCYLAVTKLKAAFGYDDSLDVFGVHGVGSTTGMLMLGFLASPAVNPLIATTFSKERRGGFAGGRHAPVLESTGRRRRHGGARRRRHVYYFEAGGCRHLRRQVVAGGWRASDSPVRPAGRCPRSPGSTGGRRADLRRLAAQAPGSSGLWL